MANQEVGSAYIEVSAKLDKNAGKDLKKGLEDVDVKDSGKKLGEEVGDGVGAGIDAKAVAIGNIVANVVTAAAQKAAQLIGDVIGGAFENYANYQQLTGGVEKLFGDSSGQVMQYAQQAYMTAGLSANEYMEQVTSFSASMISSLNGDTAEAARISNQAIMDMSDNANVFGTRIEDIQRAYQSFARGQFGMLDNLRLGYGGTRTEMQRLLADAEAISGVHYDIENYADIATAIGVIQQNMGITGTTAAEAAKTISGSLSMLSASWQNWLTAIGGGGDLSEATAALVDALGTMASNALPELGKIISSLVAEIPNLLSQALQSLPSMAIDFVSALFGEGAGESLNGVFAELAPTVESLAAAFGDMATRLAPVVAQMLPALMDVGAAVGNVLLNILQTLGNLISAVLPYITSFLEWILPHVANVVEFIASGIQLISGLFDEETGVIATLQSFIIDMGQAFGEVASGIGSAWESLVQFFSGIPARISSFFASLPSKISGFFQSALSAVTGIGEQLVSFWASIPQRILSFFSNIGSAISGFFRNIKLPHIKVDNFSLNPVDWVKNGVPKLWIEWAATGGLVDGATLIGAGEAGREAIVPLENRNAMQPFATAVSEDLQDNGTFADILAVLVDIRDRTQAVYLDKEAVGRVMAPGINKRIGNNSVMVSRGGGAYAF